MNATARREPRKHGYSYREGLTMMAAQAVGIDPYLAAEAGEDPKNALNLLRKARKTEDRQARADLLQEAQNELRYVDAVKHPELVNAISAKILAAQGRGGDSEIAHVTPGEMVLHPDQLSPTTRAMILADLAARGVDPQGRLVGPHAASNPQTAAPQYASANTARTWKTDPPKHVPNHVFTYDRNRNFIRDHFISGTSLPPQSPDFAAKGVHQPPFRPDPGTYILDLGPTKQDTMRFDAIENSPRAIAGNSSAIQDPAETLPTPFCSADKRIAAQPLIREFGDLQVALYWARRRSEQLAADLEDKGYSPSDNMILMNERTIQNTQIKLLEKRMDGLIEKLRATLPGCEKDLQRDA